MYKPLTRKDQEQLIQVRIDTEMVEGSLVVPAGATGIVLFAEDTIQNRRWNRFLAGMLNEAGLATLTIDLFTSEEYSTGANGHCHCYLNLLAGRLVRVTDWVRQQVETEQLKIGYFGLNNGAAVALLAALKRPDAVKAIVSGDGRADLVKQELAEIRAPILLVVSGSDASLVTQNEQALAQLWTRKRMEILPGSNPLIDEPRNLAEITRLASRWFQEHLA